jgi:hypothetical protein
MRRTAWRPRPDLPRQETPPRNPAANRPQPASRRHAPNDLRVGKGRRRGYRERSHASLPGSATRDALRRDEATDPAARPPAQAGCGRRRRANEPTHPDERLRAHVAGKPGASPDATGPPEVPSGTLGDVGRSATESPRDHDADRPLDVVPGVGPSGSALPREQVPVGSAASGRQRGNPPGTVPATKVVGQGRTDLQTQLARQQGGLRPTQESTTQVSTAEPESLDSEAEHGEGAPTPGPVDSR